MTISELERLFKSKERVKQQTLKEKASFDYILADLIGRSVGRIYSEENENTFPSLTDSYSALFKEEKEEKDKEEQKLNDEASVIRFKQFANSFNRKFNKEVVKNEWRT